MRKIMLVNVTHSEESRVGILNDGVLESFEIESLSREHLKGNIYKGTVRRIHPALEAAFVDIGAERDAFLPLDEICFRNLPHLPPPAPEGENGKRRPRIRDLIKPGEEILVQIAKEQFGNKPPTLTTFYSLPGRYLVLLPGSDDTTGISRRIEGDERQRLRQLISELNLPEGFGLIVRTAAGLDEDTGELARDLSYLQRLWERVVEASQHQRPPALVYREHDIVLRTIRDFFTPDIDEIHVDNEEVYQRAREFLQQVMPGREHVVRHYHGEQPIFSAFDVESQIESVFKRRVPLRSGGTIVIDGTEALTAIDVNSGGSVRGPNPEETAFRTNQEAAAEIARQLRLRDIGGLIVVDFIDMRDARHIQEVERTLRDAMKPDRARHEIGRISRLGLLEISRQRMRPAVMATSYTTCAMCEGHGAVRTTESAALVALRKIHNRVALGDVAALRVALPPAVALYLLNQKRDELARLEQRYESRIAVELAETLMPHQIELEARERPRIELAAAVPHGGVAPSEVPAPANGNGATPAAASTGKRKRRRRGRRRGSSLRAAAAIGDALAALGGGVPAPGAPQAALETPPPDATPAGASDTSAAVAAFAPAAGTAETDVAVPAAAPLSKRARRGRRGGRQRAAARGVASSGSERTSTSADPVDLAVAPAETVGDAPATAAADDDTPPLPRRTRRARTTTARKAAAKHTDAAAASAGAEDAAAPVATTPTRRRASAPKSGRPKTAAAGRSRRPPARKRPPQPAE